MLNFSKRSQCMRLNGSFTIIQLFWFLNQILVGSLQAEWVRQDDGDPPMWDHEPCNKPVDDSVCSVQPSHSVVSDSLRPLGQQHTRRSCPSPTLGACSNSCPLSRWCHQTILSSVVPFSCPHSFLSSGSYPVSQFFASGGQSIGILASASVLPMNIQDWFH